MAHTKMVEEDLGERNNNYNKLVFYAQSTSMVISGR